MMSTLSWGLFLSRNSLLLLVFLGKRNIARWGHCYRKGLFSSPSPLSKIPSRFSFFFSLHPGWGGKGKRGRRRLALKKCPFSCFWFGKRRALISLFMLHFRSSRPSKLVIIQNLKIFSLPPGGERESSPENFSISLSFSSRCCHFPGGLRRRLLLLLADITFIFFFAKHIAFHLLLVYVFPGVLSFSLSFSGNMGAICFSSSAYFISPPLGWIEGRPGWMCNLSCRQRWWKRREKLISPPTFSPCRRNLREIGV